MLDKAFRNLEIDEVEEQILLVTLARPKALNALNVPLLDDLLHVFEHIHLNKNFKAIVITGKDKAFCAGADISELASLNGHNGFLFAKRGQKVFNLLENLGLPSIAAINGFAFGGGLELAMSASMRIASNKASMGQPEIKLGVLPGFGGSQRLSRLIGKGRAMDLCLTGRTVDADFALSSGLVNEVCKPNNLLPRAIEIARELRDLPPVALNYILDVINKGSDVALEDALELEASYFGLCCSTKDKQLGVDAFLNKTKPKFTGE